MKRPIVASVLLLVACSKPAPQEQQRPSLMDQIERSVVLPEGARLRDYERYYSFDDHRRVVGVYVGRPPRYGPDERRHWVKRIEDLPMVMDGGCGVITLLYDPATEKVVRVSCNGGA